MCTVHVCSFLNVCTYLHTFVLVYSRVHIVFVHVHGQYCIVHTIYIICMYGMRRYSLYMHTYVEIKMCALG